MKITLAAVSTSLSGREILHDISVEFPANRISLLAGGNGSGKSTLLKTIAGLIAPDAGEVNFGGMNINSLPRKEMARRCAILLQEPYAPAEMKVAQLAALGRYPYGGGSCNAPEVKRALEDAGISYAANREVGKLSGGERRKAFLARALAQESELLLLDEPESALDAAARSELLNLLCRLHRERKLTVIMAAHDLDFAVGVTDFVCGIKSGRICFCGEPETAVTTENLHTLLGVDIDLFHDRRGRLRVLPEYGRKS